MPIRLDELPSNGPRKVIVLTHDVPNLAPDRRVKHDVFCQPVLPKGMRLTLRYHPADPTKYRASQVTLRVPRTQTAEGRYGTYSDGPNAMQVQQILDAAEFEPRDSVRHILDVYEDISAREILEQLVKDGSIRFDTIETVARRLDNVEPE